MTTEERIALHDNAIKFAKLVSDQELERLLHRESNAAVYWRTVGASQVGLDALRGEWLDRHSQ